MGGAEQCSMLYLESRCVSLARAMGVQGVQNGGIDGASVAGAVPARRPRADGRERHGDGPQPRGLHRQRRADVGVRRTPDVADAADPARRHRLRLQRLRLDPALRQHVRAVAVERRGHRRLAGHAARLGRRRRAAHRRCPTRSGGCGAAAAEACRDVYRWLGLADFTDEHVELAVDAVGSKDLAGDPDPMVVLGAAQAIRSSGLGSLEVARALQECGYDEAAERVLDMLAARVHGDHLQTAAIFDESMRVLSLVTDPNDYAGPGHRLRARRRAAGRDRRRSGRPAASRTCAPTRRAWPTTPSGSSAPRRRAVTRARWSSALSPGVGRTVWRTLSGLPVVDVLARAARRPGGGGLPGPRRAGQRHPRPRAWSG